MMGKNHVVTNLSAGLLALDAGAGIYYSSTPVFNTEREWLNTAVNSMIGEGSFWGYVKLGGCVAFAMAIFLFAALLPDIDTPDSMLGRFVPIHGKHRTWSHTVWIPLLICALGYEVSPWFYVLAAGYTWHLVMDSISACGICWFWPFQKYRDYGNGARVAVGHKVKLYHAGDTMEVCIAWFMLVVAIIVTIATVFTLWG